jgi:4-hydroxybenzoate polyprenyltransferase
LRAWLLNKFTGMLLSATLSWKLLLFNGFFAFLLWFYSHKLKKKPFLGNLAAAVLTVASFFAVCVYYGFVNEVIWIYACFIVLVTLIREVVKDLEAMKGDVVFGYQTFPVVYGLPATKRLLYALMLASALPFAWLYFQQPTPLVLGFLAVSVLLLAWSAQKIAKSVHAEEFTAVNNVLKLLILLGVGSIALL